MDADRVNRWLTLGANIGTLIGLILVGFEIKQNSTLVRAQVVDSNFSDQQTWALSQVGEDSATVWAKSVEDPGSITLTDI